MEYNDEKRNFTLTATGDIFITRKLTPYTEPKKEAITTALEQCPVVVLIFSGGPLVVEHAGKRVSFPTRAGETISFDGALRRR